MTELEMMQALQTQLLAEVWPGGSDPVFPSGSVVITAGMERRALEGLRPPILLMSPGNAVNDPDDPNLVEVTLDMVLAVAVPGDALGQNALVGANRVDATLSGGAGLLLVQERMHSGIGKFTRVNGVAIHNVAAGRVKAEVDSEDTYIARRGYQFKATVSQVT